MAVPYLPEYKAVVFFPKFVKKCVEVSYNRSVKFIMCNYFSENLNLRRGGGVLSYAWLNMVVARLL